MMIVCCVFNTTNAQDGDPSVFGDNVWNVYAYNSDDTSFPVVNYAGFYTESNVSFDTQTRWDSMSNPSQASGYVGNPVSDDYHSFAAKRQGFTPGYYTIDIPGHDDVAFLFIDGVEVWNHYGCCDSHSDVWHGVLDANSTIEYRITEQGGYSYGSIKIAMVTIDATVANFSSSSCQTTVTVTATGGQPPYTGTGVFTVSPGTYDYTVTDSYEQTSTMTVVVKDNSKPTVSTQEITVNLDANGEAVVTPEMINNNSLDNCGPVTLSLDKTTFNCSDIGVFSVVQAVEFANVPDASQNIHSWGGGYNPNTNEFWYPAWDGSTIYKYDTSHNATGSFNAPGGIGQIIQLWMDKSSSDYYTANWDYGTINRIDENAVVWSYYIGGQAAGVTTNDSYVFAYSNDTQTIVVLDKATGDFVKNITLPGNFYTYGGLVYANGIIYISGRDQNGFSTFPYTEYAIHSFDAETGNYISSVQTSQPAYNTAFDGETIWISDSNIGSTILNGYKISDGNAYDKSGLGNRVTLTVTDAAGNTVTRTALVVVKDNIAPVITSNGDKTVDADSGVCGANVTVVSASATDNCSVGIPTGVRRDGLLLSDLYPIGATIIDWNVTDANGNAAVEVAQTVIVNDNEVPVITADVDKDVNIDLGLCSANVTIVSASATDNCSVGTPTGVRSDSLLLSDPYPIGTTTITWKVTDANGNAADEVTQKVRVRDNIEPTALAKNLTVQLDATGNASITASQINNGSFDNCGIASITVSPDSFAIGDAGDHVVTLTVTDNDGLSSIATAIVTVNSFFANTITRNLDTLSADESSATTYQWMTCDGGNYVDILGENNLSFTPTAIGSYSVDITKNGSTRRSDCVDINTLGNKDFDFNSKLSVYPNPFKDEISVNVDANAKVEIFNLIGEIVYNGKINSGTTSLNLSNIATGVYLMKITTENNQSKTVKIVKK